MARAYAKFPGAPLKVHKITNLWRNPTGTLPALKTTEESIGSLSKPSNVIIHLRKQLYHDVPECMNLLSHRLGLHKFFFRDSPSSLDAYVFGHLVPLLKVKLPTGKLHQHLNSQDNLRHYCTNGLVLYFPSEGEVLWSIISQLRSSSSIRNSTVTFVVAQGKHT
ncbi:metaxin-1-like [Oncorhynchus keta]|uniref:metaxin-1-like n=1 Tax=Oncorhynchus keta TaxID=8018 RepID=UPI00227CDCF4|nr:metaxin-1-like [Oncorhynchus keta]